MSDVFDSLTPAQQHTARTMPVAGELLTVMLSDLIRRATSDLPQALTEFRNQDSYDYIAELTDGEFISETVDAHMPGLDITGRSSARYVAQAVLQALLSLTWPNDKTAAVLTARAEQATVQAEADRVAQAGRDAIAVAAGAHCLRHQGAWGTDFGCPHCTEDGRPLPAPLSGPEASLADQRRSGRALRGVSDV